MQNQLDVKRRLLLGMPVVIVPFVTVLFYILGGGTPVVAETVHKPGLNTTVPSADLSGAGATDKLSLYQKADKDSLRRAAQYRSEGYLTGDDPGGQPAVSGAVSTPFSPAGSSSYVSSSIPPTRAQRSEARIDQRLRQLQDEMDRDPTTARHPDPALADKYYRAGAPQSSVEETSPVMSASTPAAIDPEIAALSGMLDKIVKITNPVSAAEQARKSSLADKSRVFPVSAEVDGQVVDFFDGGQRPPILTTDTAILSLLANPKISPAYTSADLRQIARNDFYDLDNQQQAEVAMTIAAVIHETKTVVEGATIKLRLEQGMYIQGRLIPAGTFVYGKCSVAGDRMIIPINEIKSGAGIYPVDLQVFGLDGQEGVHVEGSITGDVSKQSANDALQSLQLAAMDPTITQQAASAGIETVKTIFSRKIRLKKLTIKAGHPVLLMARQAGG